MKTKIIRSVLCIALAVVLALTFAACGDQKKPDVTYENGGFTLVVPGDHDGLLTVEAPESSDEGILFSVSEKASIEAAEAVGMDPEGAGWLFAIGTVSEDALHQMLCYDMSGADVFAKGADGTYYMYYHPTDVRIMRDGDISDDDMAQWSALNEWAASVPESFIAGNEGLTPEKRGNTDLDMYLNRAAYLEDTIYTVSTTEFGPKTGDGAAAQPYVDVLTNGMTLERMEEGEAPDGEYVVLYFPVDDVRFDFFMAQDNGSFVRQIWSGNEMIYKISYDGDTNAAAVMNEWYQALANPGVLPVE
ncbi:MAG: hypothetical protein IJG50_04855 [Clostridia bacterium]|nr:hypothetical protein [Clostridia bacterium]